MNDKSKAFELLLDELSTALADVVDTLKAGQETGVETATALADIVELLEARKAYKSVEDLVAAVKAIRIKASDVTVQVSPTPVNMPAPVVQILERVQPGAYEMTFTYDRMDRLQTARLVPVAIELKIADEGPKVFGFPE